MTDVTITVEEDPVPIVKIIAAQFRRSLRHRAFVRAARGFNGTFALASTTDPQAVTVSARSRNIHVSRGVSGDAKVVVRLDFNSDQAPTVEGLWRHPLLALRVGKLMETYEKSWTDSARQFWEQTAGFPGMPAAIRLHCTDDDSELTVGEGAPEVELEGSAGQLIEILTGANVFVLAALQGKIRAEASLQHATVLSEVTKKLMLGEL